MVIHRKRSFIFYQSYSLHMNFQPIFQFSFSTKFYIDDLVQYLSLFYTYAIHTKNPKLVSLVPLKSKIKGSLFLLDVLMHRPKPFLFSQQLLACSTIWLQLAPLISSYHPTSLQSAAKLFATLEQNLKPGERQHVNVYIFICFEGGNEQ